MSNNEEPENLSEIIEQIEMATTQKELSIHLQQLQNSLKSCESLPVDFTEVYLRRVFDKLFNSDKVFKTMEKSLEDQIFDVFTNKLIVDQSYVLNIISEYLLSQQKRQTKPFTWKRQLLFALFEELYLHNDKSLEQALKAVPEGEIRWILLQRFLRMQTDFQNFLEEGPISLSNNRFYGKLLRIADSLKDQEITLRLIDKVVLCGCSELLANLLVSGNKNEKQDNLKFVNKICKLQMPSISKHYLLIGHIIRQLSLQTRQTQSNISALIKEEAASIIKGYLEKFEENQLLAVLIDRILFTFTFTTETSGLLVHFFKEHLSEVVTNLIRQIMEKINLKDIEEPAIMDCLTKGITFRFETFAHFEYVRSCSHCVWKGLVKKLELKVEDTIDADEFKSFNEYPDLMNLESIEGDELDGEQQQQQISRNIEQNTGTNDNSGINSKSQENVEKSQEDKQQLNNNNDEEEVDSEEESFYEVKVSSTVDDPLVLQPPKHLYDCLLGLRSESRKRFELSLKHLNYLIRKNVEDLAVLWEDLTNQLLRIHSVDNYIPKFDEYKKRALLSLCIFKPEQVAKLLIDRFFSEDSYLGDKHFLISIFTEAAQELSDNPKKYLSDSFNEFEPKDDGVFYFKKISTSYYPKKELSEEQKKADEEKKQRTESKTRRWGETRIRFQENQQGEGLKKMNRQELLIINNRTDAAFVNRFNQLIQSFYFPLLVPLRTNHGKLLRKEVFLLSNVFALMMSYLHAAQNSLLFYRMVEEALDYVEAFKDLTDLNLTRVVLQCVLKITMFVKKDILLKHPIVMNKLIQASQTLAERGLAKEQDDVNRYLMSVISQNITKLFSMTEDMIF